MRAEIQARIEAVRKLRDDHAADAAALRSHVSRAEQKVDLVLETQRALNGKHDALRGEHDALEKRAREEVAAAKAEAKQAVADARAAAEARATRLADSLESRTKELETMCQDGITDLEEDTRQKLTQTWNALTKSVDSVKEELTNARAELVQSDSSLIELVKALGDKLDVLQLSELPEINAQLDEMSGAMAAEQEAMRGFVQESLKVRPFFVSPPILSKNGWASAPLRRS